MLDIQDEVPTERHFIARLKRFSVSALLCWNSNTRLTFQHLHNETTLFDAVDAQGGHVI